MAFDTYAEFRNFLDGASVALCGRRASTNRKPRTTFRENARDEKWWKSTGRQDGNGQESLMRNRAYLLAYFEAKPDRFPAIGICIGDGSIIWPDRSVMERSMRDGYVEFDAKNQDFVLTRKGIEFIRRAEK
jgi:hypothetical protein